MIYTASDQDRVKWADAKHDSENIWHLSVIDRQNGGTDSLTDNPNNTLERDQADNCKIKDIIDCVEGELDFTNVGAVFSNKSFHVLMLATTQFLFRYTPTVIDKLSRKEYAAKGLPKELWKMDLIGFGINVTVADAVSIFGKEWLSVLLQFHLSLDKRGRDE